MKRLFLAAAILFFLHIAAFAVSRTSVNIWANTPQLPGTRVMLEVTVPDEPNGTAVIICPGGSYHHLGVFNEGRTTAKWFSSRHASTFLLCYRTAQDNYHYPAMMQDIQRAIQLVREHAGEYGVDASKIGVIGFSAGGHLALWSGAIGGSVDELAKLGIETDVSLRPDFVIPVYPVVSMQDDIGHKWSRKSLLGRSPSQQQKDSFSMELQIPVDMPPTYLVACKDDRVVCYENSVRLYEALQAHHVDSSFASYDKGGHGFGMQTNKVLFREYHWAEQLALWLEARGFL